MDFSRGNKSGEISFYALDSKKTIVSKNLIAK